MRTSRQPHKRQPYAQTFNHALKGRPLDTESTLKLTMAEGLTGFVVHLSERDTVNQSLPNYHESYYARGLLNSTTSAETTADKLVSLRQAENINVSILSLQALTMPIETIPSTADFLNKELFDHRRNRMIFRNERLLARVDHVDTPTLGHECTNYDELLKSATVQQLPGLDLDLAVAVIKYVCNYPISL